MSDYPAPLKTVMLPESARDQKSLGQALARVAYTGRIFGLFSSDVQESLDQVSHALRALNTGGITYGNVVERAAAAKYGLPDPWIASGADGFDLLRLPEHARSRRGHDRSL